MGSQQDISSIKSTDWAIVHWGRDSRYYSVYIQQDLWGNWIVTRVWGRKGSRLGGVKDEPCVSYEEALTVLESIKVRRHKRRYCLT